MKNFREVESAVSKCFDTRLRKRRILRPVKQMFEVKEYSCMTEIWKENLYIAFKVSTSRVETSDKEGK